MSRDEPVTFGAFLPLTPLPFAPFFFLAHVTVNAPRRDDQARVAVVAAVAAVRPGARAAVPRGRNPHELSPCGVGGPAANARTRARRGVPTRTPRPAADAMDAPIDAISAPRPRRTSAPHLRRPHAGRGRVRRHSLQINDRRREGSHENEYTSSAERSRALVLKRDCEPCDSGGIIGQLSNS